MIPTLLLFVVFVFPQPRFQGPSVGQVFATAYGRFRRLRFSAAKISGPKCWTSVCDSLRPFSSSSFFCGQDFRAQVLDKCLRQLKAVFVVFVFPRPRFQGLGFGQVFCTSACGNYSFEDLNERCQTRLTFPEPRSGNWPWSTARKTESVHHL